MTKYLLAFALGLALARCPATAKCPLHGNLGTYVRDEFPDGKHVKVFSCSWGHLFSIVC